MGTKLEQLAVFKYGWQHGAVRKERDTRFTDHANESIRALYNRGYTKGEQARLLCFYEQCEMMQYDPKVSVLTAAIPDDPPPMPKPYAQEDRP